MPKTRPWSEIRTKIDADPERRARVDEGVRALRDGQALVALRTSLGLPEYDWPEEAEVSDEDTSPSEREEEIYVADLRAFVKAMGGRLEINAVFPDSTMTLVPGRRWTLADSGDETESGTVNAGDGMPDPDSVQEAATVGAATSSRRGR